jgi:hypothetical protein
MADGVTIKEVVYRGSPWVDEVWRTTVKVNLRHVPLNFHVNLALDPVATVYTENAKNYDYLFVPYHTSFAFLSDINRYRKNSQPIVPFFESPMSVLMLHRQYSDSPDIGMTIFFGIRGDLYLLVNVKLED